VAVETCAIPPFRILTKRVYYTPIMVVNGALYEVARDTPEAASLRTFRASAGPMCAPPIHSRRWMRRAPLQAGTRRRGSCRAARRPDGGRVDRARSAGNCGKMVAGTGTVNLPSIRDSKLTYVRGTLYSRLKKHLAEAASRSAESQKFDRTPPRNQRCGTGTASSRPVKCRFRRPSRSRWWVSIPSVVSCK
jgi:hypothetical protein